MQEHRERILSPSGVEFALVDRGARGFRIDLKLPGVARRRDPVRAGDREQAARAAVALVERIVRDARSGRAEAPSLVRVGAELIDFKRRSGKAETYLRSLEAHIRNYILPFFG